MDEFVGGPGAVEELPVVQQAQKAGSAIDDDLDPSGRPYRGKDPRIGGGNLGDGWGRIVRTVFRIDEEDAFAKCMRVVGFARKPSQMEYGELTDALDELSTTVVLASQLYENAKVVRTLYEADVAALRAPMHRQAKDALTAEKAEKGGKQITDADVVSKIVELWPDDYRRQEENLAKAKGTVAHIGEIFERLKSRAKELDGLVRTNRKV
jgi:hypothetical protein